LETVQIPAKISGTGIYDSNQPSINEIWLNLIAKSKGESGRVDFPFHLNFLPCYFLLAVILGAICTL
jgi:hypothetical protein